MNIINLQFDSTVTRLAGNPYGRKVYDEQVKDKINFEFENQIIFPKQIINIASSFVQGFFEEIISNVGILGVGKQIIIIADGIDIQKVIIDNLR